MLDFYKQLAELTDDALCVSIIKGDGTGSKAIWQKGNFIYQEGSGSVLKNFEPELAKTKKNQLLTLNGSTAFCEFMSREKHLIVCGAGHISMPIIKIGKMLDFKVTVIDDRLLFANNARAAGADTVFCEPFAQALAKIDGGSNYFFVIVTRGHRYDQVCLTEILSKENAYTGMIGSRVRVKKIMELLAAEGFEPELLKSVHSPIGLKIGAQTPSEIAVAIMAEIIQIKSQTKNSFGYPEEILS
ncbi:MAG: XdhC family protein, partial [Sporomusaceae bacterium]|nr:XdhC family protein [Sporomusaceae bacterium]